jgi:hypothetical protein
MRSREKARFEQRASLRRQQSDDEGESATTTIATLKSLSENDGIADANSAGYEPQ